jgi:hypothetical protein
MGDTQSPGTDRQVAGDTIRVRVTGVERISARGSLVAESMAPDVSLREVSATAPFRSTFTEGFGAILVDGACPTWLLATLDGQIQRRAQIKVPPFSGRTEVEIALDSERRACSRIAHGQLERCTHHDHAARGRGR